MEATWVQTHARACIELREFFMSIKSDIKKLPLSVQAYRFPFMHPRLQV